MELPGPKWNASRQHTLLYCPAVLPCAAQGISTGELTSGNLWCSVSTHTGLSRQQSGHANCHHSSLHTLCPLTRGTNSFTCQMNTQTLCVCAVPLHNLKWKIKSEIVPDIMKPLYFCHLSYFAELRRAKVGKTYKKAGTEPIFNNDTWKAIPTSLHHLASSVSAS